MWFFVTKNLSAHTILLIYFIHQIINPESLILSGGHKELQLYRIPITLRDYNINIEPGIPVSMFIFITSVSCSKNFFPTINHFCPLHVAIASKKVTLRKHHLKAQLFVTIFNKENRSPFGHGKALEPYGCCCCSTFKVPFVQFSQLLWLYVKHILLHPNTSFAEVSGDA